MSELFASYRKTNLAISAFSALLVTLSIAYPIKNAQCAIGLISYGNYPFGQPDRLERAIVCPLSLSSPMQRTQFRSYLPQLKPATYHNGWQGPQPRKAQARSLFLQSNLGESKLSSINILEDIQGKQRLETQTLGLTFSPKSTREGSAQRKKTNILNYLMTTFFINQTRDYTEFQVHLPY